VASRPANMPKLTRMSPSSSRKAIGASSCIEKSVYPDLEFL
jgi:hypothetical protein